MHFNLLYEDSGSAARVTELACGHGIIRTPCFMPVGTNATVKAIRIEDLEEIGISMILSNAYHLYLRPGIEVIQHAGGLHRFMAWEHNILTDSGGFQIFSLAPFRRLEEGGVRFRSHIDGSLHQLGPEEVIDIQAALGSDIMMPLDVCSPPGIERKEAEQALRLTTEWARRSLRHWQQNTRNPEQQLFGIIQGNFYQDLRRRSAEEIISLGFPGYAIGGLSVGEPFEQFKDLLHFTSGFIPRGFPRYLMGIGTPPYILEAVESGIDLFDCVFPTRTARNALAFTRRGPLSLRREELKFDTLPIDPDCSCSTCSRYTRSYLRHLFKTKEILAAILTTYHNLFFIQELIRSIREAIRRSRFSIFKREFLQLYGEGK